MPTFTEILPPTKTEPAAGLDWTPGDVPGAGTLTIKQKRLYCTYAVTEFVTPWDGRAFHLVKLDTGSDATAEQYDVFVCRNGQDHQCSCKGFAYGRGKPCKHILAGLALIGNGWV